jgi:hypothetical protein
MKNFFASLFGTLFGVVLAGVVLVACWNYCAWFGNPNVKQFPVPNWNGGGDKKPHKHNCKCGAPDCHCDNCKCTADKACSADCKCNKPDGCPPGCCPPKKKQ